MGCHVHSLGIFFGSSPCFVRTPYLRLIPNNYIVYSYVIWIICFQIYLPSGVQVTIKRMYWGLSTYIKAPTPYNENNPNSDHHSEGLCGNYNGNANDEFSTFQNPVQFAELQR